MQEKIEPDVGSLRISWSSTTTVVVAFISDQLAENITINMLTHSIKDREESVLSVLYSPGELMTNCMQIDAYYNQGVESESESA